MPTTRITITITPDLAAWLARHGSRRGQLADQAERDLALLREIMLAATSGDTPEKTYVRAIEVMAALRRYADASQGVA